MRKLVVLSLGGSLIVPDKIDYEFLKNFRDSILKFVKKGWHFIVVAGGGKTTRVYQQAARKIGPISNEDVDWIGIHSTHLNAHLLRTIFRDIAHPFIIKHYDIIRKVTEPVVVAAGWKPGWSTDYDAVLLCEDYGVKTVINLTNVDQIYDKDPKKFSDAKPIDHISWKEFTKIVGDEWIPGMNSPFDPIAAKKATELGIKVVILNGNSFENLERYFRGEDYLGTTIE